MKTTPSKVKEIKQISGDMVGGGNVFNSFIGAFKTKKKAIMDKALAPQRWVRNKIKESAPGKRIRAAFGSKSAKATLGTEALDNAQKISKELKELTNITSHQKRLAFYKGSLMGQKASENAVTAAKKTLAALQKKKDEVLINPNPIELQSIAKQIKDAEKDLKKKTSLFYSAKIKASENHAGFEKLLADQKIKMRDKLDDAEKRFIKYTGEKPNLTKNITTVTDEERIKAMKERIQAKSAEKQYGLLRQGEMNKANNLENKLQKFIKPKPSVPPVPPPRHPVDSSGYLVPVKQNELYATVNEVSLQSKSFSERIREKAAERQAARAAQAKAIADAEAETAAAAQRAVQEQAAKARNQRVQVIRERVSERPITFELRDRARTKAADEAAAKAAAEAKALAEAQARRVQKLAEIRAGRETHLAAAAEAKVAAQTQTLQRPIRAQPHEALGPTYTLAQPLKPETVLPSPVVRQQIITQGPQGPQLRVFGLSDPVPQIT